MKEKTNIDIATLRIIYTKYREHIIYGGVILTCILVFIIFTIPIISEILGLGRARQVELDKLKILSKNLTLLVVMDNSILDSQLRTASFALPGNKDFEGVLNAISIAASKSGASLSDYNFTVGSILEKSAPATPGYPFIQVVLSLQSSEEQLISFLKNLSETVPLSQVTGINQSGGTASVTIVFYYKSTLLGGNFEDGRELVAVDSSDRVLIDTLSSWNTISLSGIPIEFGTPPASVSPF